MRGHYRRPPQDDPAPRELLAAEEHPRAADGDGRSDFGGTQHMTRQRRRAADEAAPDGAVIDIGDPIEHSGFLICDVDAPGLAVIYADLRARTFFAGRAVVGETFEVVFGLGDDGRLARRLGELVRHGESGTFFTNARDRAGRPVELHARVQPLSAADNEAPWALVTFDAVGDPGPVVDDEPAPDEIEIREEVGRMVDRLAERLGFLLPGRVRVQVDRAEQPLWVAADVEDVEEIVSCCLATAMPFDPWNYTVRLAVGLDAKPGHVRLLFSLVGDQDGAMARAPLPGGIAEQLDTLGFVLEPHRGRDGAGLALVMPLADGANGAGAEWRRR